MMPPSKFWKPNAAFRGVFDQLMVNWKLVRRGFCTAFSKETI